MSALVLGACSFGCAFVGSIIFGFAGQSRQEKDPEFGAVLGSAAVLTLMALVLAFLAGRESL